MIIDLAIKTNGYVRCDKVGNLWIKKNLFHFETLPIAQALGDDEIREMSERVEYPEFGNRILIRSAVPSSGQDIQIQLRLETRCIRGDGIAETEATAIVTNGEGVAMPNGTLVHFSIDDASLAVFAGSERETGAKIIIGELVRASGLLAVSTEFPIIKIIGVFLENDLSRETNYFTGGSFKARSITLGLELPFSDSKVIIDYQAGGIAIGYLTSVAGALEGETEIHASVGKIRDSATFCINNSRNVNISLSALPTEHNICVQSPRTSQVIAEVKVDGSPGSGAMIQWLVEGKGSITPVFSAVMDNLIAGETVRPVDRSSVAVSKQIVGVTGVWLLSTGKSGTNFYTNSEDRQGSFADNVITLGADLPNDQDQVVVDYTARAIAKALYTAPDVIGRDKIVAIINDGTSQKFEESIEIDIVNRCTGDSPAGTSDPIGGKNDCSQAAASAKVCGAANPTDRFARSECICEQETGSSCSTTESGCKDMCEKAYAKSQSNPLACESLPTQKQISDAEAVVHHPITSNEAKSNVDCVRETDGNPDGMDACLKAHKDSTIQRCTADCLDHGLAISPVTAKMPCGDANPSVTFTAKGTGPFYWSASNGKLTIASDGKSATLRPPQNDGGAVA